MSNPDRLVAPVGAFGECMMELRERDGALVRSFGGDTLNTLVYLARLVPSLRGKLFYASGLGEDAFSAQMMDAWKDEGLETGLVARVKGRLPGIYFIHTDAAGERRFHYWRERSAIRRVMTAPFAARLDRGLARMGVFYFSGISLAVLPQAGRERLLNIATRLSRAGTTLVFDSNFRPSLWESRADAARWLGRAQSVARITLSGFEDESAVFGDVSPEAACRRLVGCGAREAVIRNGAAPCTVLAAGKLMEILPEITARPVDTTAAGDAFNAGYLAARLNGEGVERAVLAANRLAGRVIMHPGAIMPRTETPDLAGLLAGSAAPARTHAVRAG